MIPRLGCTRPHAQVLSCWQTIRLSSSASVPSEVLYWWSVEGPDESSRIFGEALVRAFWELQRRSPWDWADIVRSAVHGQSSLSHALGVPEDDAERALGLLECEADVGLIVVQLHQGAPATGATQRGSWAGCPPASAGASPAQPPRRTV